MCHYQKSSKVKSNDQKEDDLLFGKEIDQYNSFKVGDYVRWDWKNPNNEHELIAEITSITENAVWLRILKCTESFWKLNDIEVFPISVLNNIYKLDVSEDVLIAMII